MAPPLHLATVDELRAAVGSRAVSASEATEAALSRAHALNPRLNAFTQILDDYARTRAAEIDRALARGEPVGPLAGVPIVLKDNICTDFGFTTCSSRFLERYASPFTATAAQRLIDAGAVVIAKTNLDEFAMGSSTENSAFGPTRNPYDPDRVPGGSSGGSAAGVAARIVPGALGSDTGGSVRQPGAFCGLVGFKPSYGLVSRWGLVAYASSLDQIGPLTRTVRDAALVLSVIAHHDPLDSTSVACPGFDPLTDLERPIQGLHIGVPREARSPSNHPAVNGAIDRACDGFRARGATIVDVELPALPHAIPAYYLVACAEASSNLARFDGVRFGRRAELANDATLFDLYARSRAEGFGPEVQRRIMLGAFALSSGYYDAYYATAMRVRRLIRDDFDRAFRGDDRRPGCHALLMPTTPGPAFRLGEKTTDPWAMYLEDLYTVPANLAGLAAISVPAGTAEVGGVRLPVGVQLIAPSLSDAQLLRIARVIESDDAQRIPPIGAV